MAEDADEQRTVGLHALDVEILERVEQDVDRLLAIIAASRRIRPGSLDGSAI